MRLLLIIPFLLTFWLNAQVTNTAFIDSMGGERLGKLNISGWMDGYYGTSFGNSKKLPGLVSSANLNQIDINLTYIDFRYSAPSFRVRFVPAYGSYMDANYYRNGGSLKNCMEASMGVRLNAKRKIWIEAGLIGSPTTNENPVSREMLTYTRSLSVEFTPYYLTGVKITAPLTSKLKGSFYVANGWQTLVSESKTPAMITQLEWTLNQNNLINWNNYIHLGTDKRFFIDVYWISKFKKWQFTACVNGGNDPDHAAKNPTILFKNAIHAQWFSGNFVAAYQLNKFNFISGRIEYIEDANNQVMKFNQAMPGYWGGSICHTKNINNNIYWRNECRVWSSIAPITSNLPIHTKTFWCITSLGIGF